MASYAQVLYVDRLDLWRVDKADEAAFEAVAATLGRSIWDRTLLALTHGQMPSPDGMPYGEFTAARLKQLRSAVRGAARGPACSAPPRVLLRLNETSFPSLRAVHSSSGGAFSALPADGAAHAPLRALRREGCAAAQSTKSCRSSRPAACVCRGKQSRAEEGS